LEEWLKGYKPEELFDGTGKLIPELAELAPECPRRMGANPARMAEPSLPVPSNSSSGL